MRKLMTSAALFSFLMILGINLQAEDYGIASYYSDSFHGRKTASGELYDKNKLTAAHNTYPFGTILRVTRLDNKKSVRVRINDRGPYFKGRIVDLSRKAAERLDIITDGHARVKIEVVSELTEAVEPLPETPKKADIIADVAPNSKETVPSDYNMELGKPAKEPDPISETIKTNIKPTGANKPEPAKEKASTNKPDEVKAEKPEATYRMAKGSDYQAYDLYKIQVFRPERKGYGVQVYSITNYENVIKQIAELQEKWFKNVLVSVEKGKDAKPHYKIILGPFEDRETAEAYKKQLKKKKNINGFVVDLSAIDYPKS